MDSVWRVIVDYCEGCETYLTKGGYNDCSFHVDNQEGTCPCSYCIVKMMCKIPCDPYEEWVRVIEGNGPGPKSFPKDE